MPDQPKPNRRERKKTVSRDRIVTAAIKLFDQQGFDATSIADIMDKADLGTGTFYNYFKSKEDVVGFLLQERLEKLRREIVSLVEAPGDGREKIYRLFQVVGNSFTDEQQARVVVLLMQGRKLPTAGVSGHAAIFHDLVRELVARSQAEGGFRQDMDTDIMTSFLLGVLMYTVRHYLRGITETCDPGAARKFHETLSLYVKLAMDGIAK